MNCASCGLTSFRCVLSCWWLSFGVVGAGTINGVVCHGGLALVSHGVHPSVDCCISSPCKSCVSSVLYIALWIDIPRLCCLLGAPFFVVALQCACLVGVVGASV